MKAFNEYLIPDVGKYFKSNNTISLKVSPTAEYTEHSINTDNIKFVGEYAFIDNAIALHIASYREMKTNFVKKLFSNDDQIAIMLNEDSEMLAFMNEWRDWMGTCIKKVLAQTNQ